MPRRFGCASPRKFSHPSKSHDCARFATTRPCAFLGRGVKDYDNPSAERTGGKVMDELVDRLVAKVGIDRAVAEKSVGIILAFLLSEGPADKVQTLMDRLPGAEAAAKAAANSSGGIGGLMGGIMGVGTKLMSAGLGMGQMQNVTREIIAFAREKAGEDV